MLYLANAFSLNMLSSDEVRAVVYVHTVGADYVRTRLQSEEWISVIGHPATAQILSRILSTAVPLNREPITLSNDDEVIVFQLHRRLPPATELTESELNEIIESGDYSFKLLRVCYANSQREVVS